MMKFKRILGYFKTALEFVLKPCIERIKSGDVRKRSRYARYYKRCKIHNNWVLYESFSGRGLLCNPYALFKEMVDNPLYRNMYHIWVLDEPENHKPLIDTFRKNRNVCFVKYESRRYLKMLCKCKYLINNSTFPTYYQKRNGQVYINTWHGIPLKKMGFDLPNGRAPSANIVRNFLHTDYLISSGAALTNMYLHAYKLESLYEGTILEEGYPRLDNIVNTDRENLINRLRKLGVEIEKDKKIILYAPTWKGNKFDKPDDDIDQYIAFKEYLNAHISVNSYQVLIKVHQAVYHAIKKKAIPNYFIPATVDANEALSITDILISDYSSIFFDFLATGRPVLFYIPDLKEYQKGRGLYLDLERLPGPYTADMPDVCKWINSIEEVEQQYKKIYMEMRSSTVNDKVGTISRKIVNRIFNCSDYGKNADHKSPKKRILILRGEMRINGISSALVNLLNHIDYSAMDVTIYITSPKDALQSELIDKISRNVRIMCRVGTLNRTLWEHIEELCFEYFGVGTLISKYIYPKKMYQREYGRCYGSAVFDTIIDFDGYNQFFSLIHLQGKSALHCIWQHADMKTEYETKYRWLKKIFKLYHYYDRIISCGYDIMVVNQKKLNGEVEKNKFTYAKNIIDTKRILSGAAMSTVINLQERNYCTTDITAKGQLVSVNLVPIESFQKLEANKSLRFLDNISSSKKTIRFITVGRLSVEKNHLSLIQAFAHLCGERDHIMLYIVGDGPQKKSTNRLIDQLNMKSQIILTGNLKNPFSLMKQCDCFILPSLYEGQPMVIHEARVLHMPIIMSNFDSARGSMVENGQLLIGTGPDDIYGGMKAFLQGNVPNDYFFDPEEYNREAYEEFLQAVF